MESGARYLFSADVILFVHTLFVAFVILGLLAILAGKPLSWAWVRNPWFRLAHLVGIGVVALQSWLGVMCPLTTWEMELRRRAGEATYSGAFIAHWLEKLLYYQAPEWAFTVCYTVFGALVAASWFWVSPRPFTGKSRNAPAGSRG
jgi:hypothetical protein